MRTEPDVIRLLHNFFDALKAPQAALLCLRVVCTTALHTYVGRSNECILPASYYRNGATVAPGLRPSIFLTRDDRSSRPTQSDDKSNTNQTLMTVIMSRYNINININSNKVLCSVKFVEIKM